MSHKTTLRQRLLAERQALAATERARHDAALGTELQAVLQARSIQILGVYWPIRSEPDLRVTYAALIASGLQLALPVVVQRDAPLQFFAWKPGDALGRDVCGVAAPQDRSQPLQPQALLIPCVGFDARGFRLGYGAGYYDRTLARPPRPYTIGVAYSSQRAEFTSDAHDIPLDLVLTEVGRAAPLP